ncbi:hypothetical protein phytr_1910 [Candidatus Phycorickettsia trachydisci]|uniref:Holo-[acyl-carrier-protein] synthase n=1 Tax=Candidatus Phycorickettsia trachydisci TaxID=2115978 RepID=A0A2P1P7A5_9RICK|nr:holo-ACP synthase [Candidatus Phycorickettsia trachydisci]AVP87149.1 hypothetical protein phytr_1910 [Candidatus Phycorickettsia trachydisci]
MILGIGTDIVNIDRIGKIYNKFPHRFAHRILSTQEEVIYGQFQNNEQKIRYLAKRFAAKEAFVKALGIGMGDISFRDISILNDARGKPYIKFAKTIEFNMELSISDEHDYAVAFVVLWA